MATVKQSSSRRARRSPKSVAASPPSSPVSRHSLLPPTTSRPELLDKNGESDLCFRQFLYDFSTLGRHIDSVRAYLASLVGLTPPQYNCAMTIAYHQGGLGVSVSDVARHLHVSIAFVTNEVGKLEKAGLVTKHHNPKDARGILLRLSADGIRALTEIGTQRRKVNDSLFRSLSAKDFAHLARIVASLVDDFASTVQLIEVLEAAGEHSFPQGLIFDLRSGKELQRQ